MALIYNQHIQFPLIIYDERQENVLVAVVVVAVMKNLFSYRFHLSKCEKAFMKWKFIVYGIIVGADAMSVLGIGREIMEALRVKAPSRMSSE